MDMVCATGTTGDMVATTDMDTTTPLLMATPATLARGLLMPSPRLRLMLRLLSCTPPTMETKDTMVNDSMVWVTTMVLNGTMDTDTEHTLMPLPTEHTLIARPMAILPLLLVIPPATLARGLLMPSPRLMPMLLTTMVTTTIIIKDTMDKGIMDSEPTLLVTHTPMAETSMDMATVSVGGR